MNKFKIGDSVIDSERLFVSAMIIEVKDKSEETNAEDSKLFTDLSDCERFVYKVRFFAYGKSTESDWIQEKNLINY